MQQQENKYTIYLFKMKAGKELNLKISITLWAFNEDSAKQKCKNLISNSSHVFFKIKNHAKIRTSDYSPVELSMREESTK